MGIAAVREGRATCQRVLSYTLNSIVRKTATVLFLALGLVMTGHAILTPVLMVVVMITGDFHAMSSTTDYVVPSRTPNAWRIGTPTLAGVVMGVGLVAFCLATLVVGRSWMGLGTGAVRRRWRS